MGKRNILLSALVVVCLTSVANAGLPLINATCPGGIEVHVDEGGPVYINGNQAKLKKVNNNYYEAKGSNVIISISINPDGSPIVSYTGKHRANGICQVSGTDQGKSSETSAPTSEKVAVKDMPRYCAGEAAAKFNQRPTHITTNNAVKDHGMYSVWGQYEVEPSPQVFICTFTADGKFVGVDKH